MLLIIRMKTGVEGILHIASFQGLVEKFAKGNVKG